MSLTIGKKCNVVFAFEPRNEDELALAVGQTVELLECPEGGWCRGKVLETNLEGWFPNNHVQAVQEQQQSSPQAADSRRSSLHPPDALSIASADSDMNKSVIDETEFAGKRRLVLFPYNPSNEDELKLVVDQSVELIQHPAGGWWEGKNIKTGETGWFPANHVEPHPGCAGENVVPKLHSMRRLSAGQINRQMKPERQHSFSTIMKDKRSELNLEIQKELGLRTGAENMLKILPKKSKKDKKARDEVFVTLSFCNARLQSLRQNLQTLNAKVHDSVRKSVVLHANGVNPKPSLQLQSDVSEVTMIALGFKETAEINIKDALSFFIQDHYGEPPSDFAEALEEFHEMRKAVENHVRHRHSRALHLRYFNQLSVVEQRFFADGKNPSIVFTWYDSFNGEPTLQRSIALEKACVLFNTGVISTQMAVSEDLRTPEGLKLAVSHFQEAAGCFQYILNHFKHAPSADVSKPSLSTLLGLCIAQAQECQLRRTIILAEHQFGKDAPIASGECAAVADFYSQVHNMMASSVLNEYIPPEWRNICAVKVKMYEAMADISIGREQILEVPEGAKNAQAAKWTGVARFVRSQKLLIEAVEICLHDLKRFPALSAMVASQLKKAKSLIAQYNRESVFDPVKQKDTIDSMLAPKPSSSSISRPTMFGFEQEAESERKDLFRGLGPIDYFNAFEKPPSVRSCTIQSAGTGFGFTLGGNNPVSVYDVKHGSPAAKAGLKRGEIVVGVNGKNTKIFHHEAVVNLIKATPTKITLALQGNVDRDLEDSAGLDESEDRPFPNTEQGDKFNDRPNFGIANHSKMLAGTSMSIKSKVSNRLSSVSMTDDTSVDMPDGAHFFGQEGRTFKNPLFQIGPQPVGSPG